MHITDFHPDPHYKTGATFDSGCHERPKKKGKKGKKGKGKGKAWEEDTELEDESGDDGLELLKSGKDLARPWGSAVS
jgi:endopolyphosphatase